MGKVLGKSLYKIKIFLKKIRGGSNPIQKKSQIFRKLTKKHTKIFIEEIPRCCQTRNKKYLKNSSINLRGMISKGEPLGCVFYGKNRPQNSPGHNGCVHTKSIVSN